MISRFQMLGGLAFNHQPVPHLLKTNQLPPGNFEASTQKTHARKNA